MPSSTSRGGASRSARRPSSGAASGASSTRPAGTAGTRRPPDAARRPRVNPTATNGRMRPATVRRLAGLAAIVVLLAIMLVPTLRRYLAQRDEISTLRRSIVEQQKQVDQLAAERATWDDPAYVEQQIRARLHFVKPGETSYVVLEPQSGRTERPDAQVVGVDLDAQQLPWYGQVWSSLSSADELGADPAAVPGATPSTSITNTIPAPSPSTAVTPGPTRR